MTEKRKPTYDLTAIKDAFSSTDRLKATSTALQTAASFGFGSREIADTIQSMERRQFVKSMTSHANHHVWQDVYHVPSKAGVLYVKFTVDVMAEFLLLSFKEKDNG